MRYGVYLIAFLAVLPFQGLAKSWQLNQPSKYATPHQSADQQRQAASYHNRHFDNLTVFAQLGDNASGFHEAQYTNLHGYRKNESADRDLRAQEEMARWAYWMMVLTGTTVLVTFAGVLLVGFTLAKTRRLRHEAEKTTKAALDAARFSEDGAAATLKAAEAAIEANKLNRDTMIADQRAWVVLKGAGLTAPIKWDDGKIIIQIAIYVKNAGKTVATKTWFDLETNITLKMADYNRIISGFRK